MVEGIGLLEHREALLIATLIAQCPSLVGERLHLAKSRPECHLVIAEIAIRVVGPVRLLGGEGEGGLGVVLGERPQLVLLSRVHDPVVFVESQCPLLTVQDLSATCP